MRGLTRTLCASPVCAARTVLEHHLNPHGPGPLALALSGGGDSIALLRAAAPWAAGCGRRVLALTVDHALHPDSSGWTAFAGRSAKEAGADWRGLAWTGSKPAAGLPAAARQARHTLLADAARAAGASVLLVAHTEDDVIESDWMRKTIAPTLGRLRVWSPSPAWPQGRGLFILRPFLFQTRASLRTWLTDQGADWLEDPGNDDLRFGRSRARAALAKVAERPAAEVTPLRAPAPRTLAGAVEVSLEGAFRLDRRALSVDVEEARWKLALILACAAGSRTPVRGRRLLGLVDRCRTAEPFVATLGGARITADGVHIMIVREPGELERRPPPSMVLHTGEEAVWDGRYEIIADQPIEVTPLRGQAARLPQSDRDRLQTLPAAVRPGLPLVTADGCARLPRPWGAGPAKARSLAGARFIAASGLVEHEREISKDHMANDRQSSYVEVLALS